MNISSAIFSGSSTRIGQKPSLRCPEFAFIGRSNVGKSSLINMLTGNGKLAMTSATPGKTRVVNHFLIDGRWYLVDLPGYGYAKLSAKSREHLKSVINDYISGSEELVMLFVLLDVRLPLQEIDRAFLRGLGENGIPFGIILTKGDKLGTGAREQNVAALKEALLQEWEELPPLFVTSSRTRLGKEELLNYIGSVLNNL